MRGCAVWLVGAVGLIQGCGGSPEPTAPVSRSATVTARVATTPERSDSDFTLTGRTRRQVSIKVQPHCAERSTELDCEGWYYAMAHYSYVRGKPDRMQCEDTPTGLTYAKDGLFTTTVDLPPSMEPPVICDDATPGRWALDASLPMADRNSSTAPRTTSFGVRLVLEARQGHGPTYAWTGRDGARCSGRLATTRGLQRITCRW